MPTYGPRAAARRAEPTGDTDPRYGEGDPVKRLLLAAVLVAMTLSLSGTAVLAASPSGNGTTTHRFSATYFDPVFGAMVVCKGIHQDGPRWPGDATSGGRDVFKCRSSSGPFEGVEPGQVVDLPPGFWCSDSFGATFGICVPNTKPYRVRISGDGRSYHAIVYYF